MLWMSLSLETSGQRALIRLEESVTVNCVAELHNLIVEALHAKKNVEIDFSRTREIDASVVQLLYRACQSFGREGLGVAVTGTLPEQVENSFRNVGLDPFHRAQQSLGH